MSRNDDNRAVGMNDANQSNQKPIHQSPKTSLGGVIMIWIIFAPTAVFAAIALILWTGLNDNALNAAYPVILALFFAGLFFLLVFGVARNYMRDRRNR
ncbi:MAG: hypothetical protein ACPGXK_06020 [Phycisphaerae bacterium]